MSKTTPNYKFIKPELNDPANIETTNPNWDTLDAELKSKASLSDIDGKLADKADKTYVDDALKKKADTSAVEAKNNLQDEAIEQNKSGLSSHIGNSLNPHKVTAEQVGADPKGSASAVKGDLTKHINSKNNPHEVTTEQIGAIPNSKIGVPNGVCPLGKDGKIPLEYGGGVPITLTANTEPGATVTATDGVKTLTQDAPEGVAKFSLPNAGEWRATAEKDGFTSPTKVVNVQDNYTTTIVFKPQAFIKPNPQFIYQNGLDGLDTSMIHLFSEAISNNSDIKDDNINTSEVWVDFKEIHRKLTIGDKVNISIGGTNYSFNIIGFNHDDLTDRNVYGSPTATGKAGITWQMNDLYSLEFMNDTGVTNSGGWSSTTIFSKILPNIKNKFSSDWKNTILEVNKKSGVGNRNTTDLKTSINQLFLLCEMEIYGTIKYAVPGEGTQYGWYKAGNTKIKKLNGTPQSWWTRTSVKSSATAFATVYKSGNNSSANPDTKLGVAIGFCT